MFNDVISSVTGEIVEAPKVKTITLGEKSVQMNAFTVKVYRKSENFDLVEVITPNDCGNLLCQDYVRVVGFIFSYYDNNRLVGKLRTVLYALGVHTTIGTTYKNFIVFKGTLAKKVNMRKTPSGKNICDLILAVENDECAGYCSYIPCIAWGTLSLTLQDMKLGDSILIVGRLQSREFTKIIDGEPRKFTTSEVSINNVSRV